MLKTTSAILRDHGFTGPAILLDEDRARTNIRRMAARAEAAAAVFRPHFKTHQSGAVGHWFHEAGVRCIAVSSLAMAEQFADLGWHDITVAILHNPRENKRAARLAARLHTAGGRLHLVVDDPEVTAALSRHLAAPTDIWLKIDTGYGRTGLAWNDFERIRNVGDQCRGVVRWRGLLSHSGHSYHARGTAAVQAISDEALSRLMAARDGAGLPDLLVSFGDTPCCSLARDLGACDEIRPGNFVFNDLMQLQIGSCQVKDLAAAVVCPVIGVYPARHRIVLHGGAVHLSKESLVGENGQRIYGCLGTLTAHGLGEVLPQAPLTSLSQEHGTVAMAPDAFHLVADLVPGDLVLVWPVHSCLCCDLLRDQMAAPHTI